MNDRERILMNIIDRLATTQVLCRGGQKESDFVDKDGSIYVHFGCWDDRPVQKGDLVLAQTGNLSDYKIGWVYQVVDKSTCVVREIGSNRLCNYGNEKFTRIVGMHPSQLLEGREYIFQQKVIRAFRKGDEYIYRYGGVDFYGNKATIWIREAFGGFVRGKEAVPFSFVMSWNSKTSVKRILETMRENGYGTRAFEHRERTPLEQFLSR